MAFFNIWGKEARNWGYDVSRIYVERSYIYEGQRYS